MTINRSGALVLTFATCIAAPAFAHHSFAAFDDSRTVRLEGTVKRFDWTNPHSRLFLEVNSLSDQAEEWEIELPSTGVLARQGWRPDYLKAGNKLAVRVYPVKNGQMGGRLQSFLCGNNVFCAVGR